MTVIPASSAVIPVSGAVIPVSGAVIPASSAVIPAQAGIQGSCCAQSGRFRYQVSALRGHGFSPRGFLDSGLRRNDGTACRHDGSREAGMTVVE